MVKISDVRLKLFKFVKDLADEHDFTEAKNPQGGRLLRKMGTTTEFLGWGMLKSGSQRNEFLGFSAFNCHHEVNEITKPILRKYKLTGGSAKDLTITYRPKGGLPMSSNDNLIFSELSELGCLRDIYRNFFINNSLPYFNKWNGILSIYNVIKEIKEDSETGLGQFPQYEKAVIMRLCNDKNYKEYFYEYYKSKEMYHLKDPTNSDCLIYLNAAKEMLDKLDEIKPLYNL